MVKQKQNKNKVGMTDIQIVPVLPSLVPGWHRTMCT